MHAQLAVHATLVAISMRHDWTDDEIEALTNIACDRPNEIEMALHAIRPDLLVSSGDIFALSANARQASVA